MRCGGHGRLVAMAGRRFGPPGWAEVSAVCTHPGHRGQGLSRRLVSEVMAGIRRDGNRPFLHVMHENKIAARIYEQMGFVRRADLLLTPAVRGSGTVGQFSCFPVSARYGTVRRGRRRRRSGILERTRIPDPFRGPPSTSAATSGSDAAGRPSAGVPEQ
ncbi:GNAT family N-acetyltransferase [Amycolatopsis sp. NPDC051372]|uniref:GNAT family N-acetyltransferase n=1 Tax=Amycolatopsis sp. NPDC051372 TaxID=3155669 RepID=UPI00342962CD